MSAATTSTPASSRVQLRDCLVGANPIIWSNDDFPELGGELTLERCLGDMQAAGYHGSELGNKYPRTAPELGAVLSRFGLKLVSGWHSTYLAERDLALEKATFLKHLKLLQALGSRIVIVAECTGCVHGRREASLGFDGDAYLRNVGLTTPAGEKSRSVLEQTVSRPTCEINGMIGGYTGEGFKTVIPAKASAKISFRLVSNMDPDKIRAAFRQHVRDRLPPDATVTFKQHGGSRAVSVPTTGPYLQRARDALTAEWGNEAALRGSGGSIPVAGDFKTILGLDTLLIGFANSDDRIHSPNEKYNLTSYRKGIRSWIRILAALAG